MGFSDGSRARRRLRERRGVACDADWRPWRLCRRGRPNTACGTPRGPENEDVSAEDSLQRAEVLLERLERTRQELESTQDPDRAIEILSELAEIAKEVEAALARAKKEAG